MSRVAKSLFFAFALIVLFSAAGQAATINAATCSFSAVSNAVPAAADGDTVVIPNCPAGVSWTTKLLVTKGMDLEGGLGIAGVLQESEVLLVALGAGDLTGGLLDPDALRKVFAFRVMPSVSLMGHDYILESGQSPDSQDEGVIPQPQGDEDDSTGRVRGVQSSAEEPAPVVADGQAPAAAAAPAIAPPAAANPEQRDGDLMAAALGLAGLLGVQPPPPAGGRRCRPGWDAMRRAAAGILLRLRKAAGSIAR